MFICTMLPTLISDLKDGIVHFVVDNVGLDILSDLVLATLLSHYNHSRIIFHVKKNPMCHKV